MKKLIAAFVTAALLLNAMASTLAHAATYLQDAEVNANTLIRDAYVQVTYYDSNGEQKLAKGWIDTIGETTFKIRGRALFGKKTIAYDIVLSVIMSEEATSRGKQINEVDRFIRDMKKREARALETEQAAIQRLNQEAVTIISRGQIDSSKITKGWYAHVVYTSQGATGTATSRIADKDSSRIALKYGFDAYNINYDDIDTLVVDKQWRDIERYREIGAKYDARVRFKVPTVSRKRITGRLINVTQDTLIIEAGRTLYQVPVSSISNLEVSTLRYNKGFKIGLGAGAVIIGYTSIYTYREKKRIDQSSGDTSLSYYTLHIATLVGYFAGAIVCLLSTLIGATIKSDKWVEVPPQRLNLSLAPTSTKGLRAALTFNF